MAEKELELERTSLSWRSKALMAGALIGALVGLGSAYLMVVTAEKHGRELKISAGEGVRLSLLVMGLLRQIAQLGEGGKE